VIGIVKIPSSSDVDGSIPYGTYDFIDDVHLLSFELQSPVYLVRPQGFLIMSILWTVPLESVISKVVMIEYACILAIPQSFVS